MMRARPARAWSRNGCELRLAEEASKERTFSLDLGTRPTPNFSIRCRIGQNPKSDVTLVNVAASVLQPLHQLRTCAQKPRQTTHANLSPSFSLNVCHSHTSNAFLWSIFRLRVRTSFPSSRSKSTSLSSRTQVVLIL